MGMNVVVIDKLYMCGTCWRWNGTCFIRRHVVSIPFGHTQREADGFGEKNWIYRGQSKCIAFYSRDITSHKIWITSVQQCILFKGDKRRDIDLEFALNTPNITVWPTHSHPYLSWLEWWIPSYFSGLRGPFSITKKKSLNCVFDFIVYFYKFYGSIMDASNLNITNQFHPLLFRKILLS